MRNLVVVVLDSLRYDTWVAVDPSALRDVGRVERRWSYASWTAPSHYNLLMGLLPHTSPTHVYASEHYKRDFERYSQRLGVDGVEFRSLLPSLYLPTFLRRHLGYRTCARVSLPVLNRHTPINRDFDDYRLMDRHNDFAGMLTEVDFRADQPTFWLLNVGETHYPYATPDEDPSDWPQISGVHGTLRRLGDVDIPSFFDDSQMRRLRQRQARALDYCDEVLARLVALVPDDTWIIVTSDHGELFGEDGYFGHGPINHDKVYEVPFVEGLVRS